MMVRRRGRGRVRHFEPPLQNAKVIFFNIFLLSSVANKRSERSTFFDFSYLRTLPTGMVSVSWIIPSKFHSQITQKGVGAELTLRFGEEEGVAK